MYKLFSVDCGFLEAPNFTRVLHTIVLLAETDTDALRYAVQLCPADFAECPVHRVVEIKHLIIDYTTGGTVFEENKPKEYHC